jgi:4-hydroxyphenylpyruvate dioxygenase-like putative hemolysin
MNNSTSLFQKYIKFTPTFRYIKRELFNNKIIIDHIAYRSFNYDPIIQHYKNRLYELKKDIYTFDNINVKATWMKSNCCRVFISQYEGKERFLINSFLDYKEIKSKNDYVAWTLLHGNDINHVALEVRDIYEIIDKINKDGSIELNNKDNPVKVSRDGNLLQASTIADKIHYKFPDGNIHLVPYTFVEFVERRNNREGFESENAREIFKSTNI